MRDQLDATRGPRARRAVDHVSHLEWAHDGGTRRGSLSVGIAVRASQPDVTPLCPVTTPSDEHELEPTRNVRQRPHIRRANPPPTYRIA